VPVFLQVLLVSAFEAGAIETWLEANAATFGSTKLKLEYHV
jgi:hypothetical protein